MITNQRVLMVVNPISGGNDKEPIIEHVNQVLESGNCSLEIFYTSGKKDKEALAASIAHFLPDRLLCVGGDGTLKLIAEIIGKEQIPIGLFPAGSANGLAENLDLPARIEDLTRVALGDSFVLLDTININGELCLHISDVGLNAALIKNYQQGNIRGKLGYLIQSIPTLIRSEFPFRFRIDLGGRVFYREAVLLAIANARKYGTGATINPHGAYDDGKFEILAFKEFNIPEILKTFRDNADLSEDFLEIYQTSEVRIDCEKDIPFQVDGEFRGEVNQVRARISPIKIKMAVPEKKTRI